MALGKHVYFDYFGVGLKNPAGRRGGDKVGNNGRRAIRIKVPLVTEKGESPLVYCLITDSLSTPILHHDE